MLKDRFGRLHDYLRISLTDHCNFRCLYCLPHSAKSSAVHQAHSARPEQMMQPEEIEKLASVFVDLGIRKIRLTGGEPLYRKDFGDILQRLAKLPVQLAITTNAFYANKYLDLFDQCGLRHVNVSLDSLQPAAFQRLSGRPDFAVCKRNIDAMIERAYDLRINCVVLNGYNDSEILDFIRWTEHQSIQVRFIEFMPFPGNEWQPEKLIRLNEIIERAQAHFSEIEKLQDEPHDTARKFRVKGFKGSFAVISTMSQPFCDSCNRLRITTDGKMRNCLFAKQEMDLLSALRKGDDLETLIRSCLMEKHYMLGGRSEQDWAKHQTEEDGRSMMGIGG